MTREAFQAAADHCLGLVYRVARSYLRHPADAEDAAQNAMLRLWRSKARFTDEAHLRHYLVRVTVNECKRIVTHPWRRRTAALSEASSAAQPGPEEDQTLYPLVMSLDAKYRVPLYLHYYEGYRLEEIGAMLGLTPAAGVTLYGDRPALSTDALSPALLERIDQAGEEGLLLAFDSWEAAADFSGLPLPQPPLLAALPMDPVCCGVGEGEAVGPVALHCVFLDGVPSGLSLHAQYRLETDVVGLSFYSHLDGSPTDADGALLTLFQPNVRFSQRDYTTAGGHSAVLITAQPEGEGETTCHGFLLLDAQLVEVQCDVPGVVEQLLDQF